VRLLLDTHVFIWCYDDSPLLGERAREAIAAGENEAFVSAVSIWEIAIKVSIGKLKLRRGFPEDVTKDILAYGFSELPVSAQHGAEVRTLPWHHSDPFDRLLIAQARQEGLTLVTTDDRLSRYDVETMAAR
jgi:PIN domain nuclease of toxin-antitoxin system